MLTAIKQTGAILATGHISSSEAAALIKAAAAFGITKMIVTHPIYQRIAMPVGVQKRLTQYEAYIEQCWSMWKIDKIPIQEIARQIKTIGANNCIITSDSGQSFSPSPDEALVQFCEALAQQGISRKKLEVMGITNPKKLLFG